MKSLLIGVVAIVALALPSESAAGCTRHILSGPSGAVVRSLWICDTAAEMPSSGLASGDLVIAIDTRALRVATNATTIQAPEVGGVGGSAAWADVSGKPSTFPPTIGSTATTAVAGNDTRLADSRTPTAHSHAISDVTSLQAGLDVKAAAVHVHAISDVTNLTSSLAGKSDTAHTHAGIPTMLRVSGNVANSTVNFADVTGLTMVVVAGQTYRFDCALSYTTAASTTALQLAVNGPAMTAVDYDVVTSMSATTVHAASQTALDTNTNPGTGGGATRLPVRISGSFIPSANGTFSVRLRSEVAASAATVMRGGFCAVY